jgi:hypothetical protein
MILKYGVHGFAMTRSIRKEFYCYRSSIAEEFSDGPLWPPVTQSRSNVLGRIGWVVAALSSGDSSARFLINWNGRVIHPDHTAKGARQ